MARALRVLVPGAWYHVVNRGVERRLIFYGQAYYQKFEQLLGLMVQQFGVRIHSYVLMPNHYHLQLASPRENLSEAIRWLNVSYAVWLNRKRGRVGPLFQGRFKAMLHDPAESGFKIQEYIQLKDYRWSSFCAYAGLVPAVRQSGGKKSHDLRITKEGSGLLRWALVESAWRMVNSNRKWTAVFMRLRKRSGAKRAIVAVARKLLCVLYAMLKTSTPYKVITT